MVEFIFTIDYEIYGNGTGSLTDLVYEPTERLAAIFRNAGQHFVIFAEVAELEMIERAGTDAAIGLIRQQVRRCHDEGHEIGLHLHSWWYNAKHENGDWILDYSEYNLCTLPREAIGQRIDRSIAYLRNLLELPDYEPLAYRAGHLLFQPTSVAAGVLAERGIKIDSSVYKGGLFHQHQLDYRPAEKNGYLWKFGESINEPNAAGALFEVPIYTRMVPTWKMLTKKRVGLQGGGGGGARASIALAARKAIARAADYLRYSYPLKLDYCSMTSDELVQTMEGILEDDLRDPSTYKPIVGIGHTKELIDFETVESFLAYLNRKGIPVSTFRDVYRRLTSHQPDDSRAFEHPVAAGTGHLR